MMMIFVLGRPQLLGYMAPITFIKRRMVSGEFQPNVLEE